MAKRKTGREWRAFLRALELTRNVRAAAASAGMDAGTAYDKRHRDAAFAAKWAAALASAREPPSRRASAGRGPELLPRTSRKHGCQLVKAAAGRWNAAAEAAFFGVLRRTGNVRRAAAACGFSTRALYKRREKYPDFAARWAAALAEARERIPDLLNAAAIASLDPEAADEDLPKVDVKDAIAICRMKGWGPSASLGTGGGTAAGRRPVRPERPIEEVRASILRKLDAIEAHEERKKAKRDGRR